MAYNRYENIVSLPGPDGKKRRPFRVDERGNVIYEDEELQNIARRLKDEPIQLAETGNPKWNGHDVLRMQGQRDGKALREYVAPGEQGAIVGGVSRTARVLDKSADVRDRYVSDVAKLDGSIMTVGLH